MNTTPATINVGALVLRQTADGIVVLHPALLKPVPVDAAALQRWLMRVIRDTVESAS